MSKKLLILTFIVLTFNLLNAQPIELNFTSTYHTGLFDESAAEIVTYDATSQRLFFSNSFANSFEILDISNPSSPTYVNTIDLSTYGGGPNSIKSANGFVAVAVEDTNKQANGKVLFFDTNGQFLNQVTAGALPDMLNISTASQKIVVANEGEPNDDYNVDPEGSVSIIDYSGGVANLSQSDVTTVSFSGLTAGDIDSSTRIFGDDGNATIAEDLEPEYVAINNTGDTAYVVCQENNAIIVIDLDNATIVDIFGLGYKDHSIAGNGFDASNEANLVDITTHPVFGMYQPDAIAYYNYNGSPYVFTANEGDARDYNGYSEEDRLRDVVLDSLVFPARDSLQNDTILGRLNITLSQGDIDNDGEFEEIYCYGARSFSVYDINSATQVFDSEDDLEQITFQEIPQYFNSTNDDNDSYKNRSDDKGPEPEALTIGRIGTRDFVFIAAERVGGIFVYEIIDPSTMDFIEYINVRDFSFPADTTAANDIAPEDLLFIPASASPNGEFLLISSNEVSGSVSVYEITVNFPVGINNELTSNSVKFFPNPSTGIINFNKEFSGVVIDIQGRVLKTIDSAKQANLNDLNPGFYLLKSNDGSTARIILE